MVKTFIREKKIFCGRDYLEVDIYSISETQLMKKNTRSKKEKISLPKQEKLNNKNARRRFVQITETNFKRNDYSVTLTYNKEYLPATQEEADREVKNYLRRVARYRKKEGLSPLKYILVTAIQKKTEDEKEKPTRIHHHILMNSGIDRNIIEDLWRRRKKKGEAEGKKIGYVNADRIQPDSNTGIAALANYLAKHTTQKRRWTCSQNLERPIERTNDHKYSRRKIIKYTLNPEDLNYWSKIYEGYEIRDKDSGFEKVYNEFTGWSIYLKLRRIKT